MKGRIAPILIVWLSSFALFYARTVAPAILPAIAKQFHLTPTVAGAVISLYTAGYAIFPVIGGFFVDHIGPRRTFGFVLGGAAVFTFLSGAVASLPALLTMRFFVGASQGSDLPCYNKVLATWFADCRGLASGIAGSAGNFGQAFALAISGLLVLHFGWNMAFFVAAIPALLMGAAALIWLRDTPEAAPKPQDLGVRQHATFQRVARSPRFWLITVSYILSSMCLWGFVAWVPSYLVSQRHFSLVHSGLASSLSFAAGIVSAFVLGWLADVLRSRHIVVSASYLLAAAALYVAYTAGSPGVAVAALTVSGFFIFGSLMPLYAFVLDVASPVTVGRAFGVFQTLGVGAGFVAPILVGYLVTTTGNFNAGFAVLVALELAAACTMLISGQSRAIGQAEAKAAGS